MKPRILTPRMVRPSAVDLVRAVVPPARPIPQRSPLPAYDPHDPVLEPQTARIPAQRSAPQLGPGPDGCRYCWCAESHHLSGYNGRVGRCKRLGCDTDCPGFKKPRRWLRLTARAIAVAVVSVLAWTAFVVAAFWVGAFIGAMR